MVNTLMDMGLSLSEVKNLTDNEYIMILATKIHQQSFKKTDQFLDGFWKDFGG